jgi:acetyltransferase-like isoleucine patch superfamily enzyme
MEEYVDLFNNVHVTANDLVIGNNVKFGKDINIKVRGRLEIGDNSIIGDRFTVNAENVTLGEYFYNGPTDSRGMLIGGGSSNFPYANLKIGSGMVCHTGHINLAAPVTIGNDVGLSHDVDLITHGFWSNILKGYPRVFEEIKIGNNVIVGWKTVIMSGVEICNDVVIGSHSTITKSLTTPKGIYVGSPAKLIKTIIEPSLDEKIVMIEGLIKDFKDLISYYDVPDFTISYDYPKLFINKLEIDLLHFSYKGEHDDITDAFRDFARRYGIRVYCPQGYRFNLKRK